MQNENLIAAVKELLSHDAREGIFDDISQTFEEGDRQYGGSPMRSSKLEAILKQLRETVNDAPAQRG